jgi:predicted CXXCH cytochrome family protein
VQSIVDMGMETVVGSIPVIQDACLACHDSAAAQAHALTNTGPAGQESCVVCHGEGGPVAVSEVHAEHLE